jgi:hypothetical protein
MLKIVNHAVMAGKAFAQFIAQKLIGWQKRLGKRCSGNKE